MREVILKLETTGHLFQEGHRIQSIICLDLDDYSGFQRSVNPEIESHKSSMNYENLEGSFPLFSDVADDLINFIGDAVLLGKEINHDLEFLNCELVRSGRKPIVNDIKAVDIRTLLNSNHPIWVNCDMSPLFNRFSGFMGYEASDNYYALQYVLGFTDTYDDLLALQSYSYSPINNLQVGDQVVDEFFDNYHKGLASMWACKCICVGSPEVFCENGYEEAYMLCVQANNFSFFGYERQYYYFTYNCLANCLSAREEIETYIKSGIVVLVSSSVSANSIIYSPKIEKLEDKFYPLITQIEQYFDIVSQGTEEEM